MVQLRVGGVYLTSGGYIALIESSEPPHVAFGSIAGDRPYNTENRLWNSNDGTHVYKREFDIVKELKGEY